VWLAVLALIALVLGAGPGGDAAARRDREPSEIAKARLVAASHAGTVHRRVDGSSHGPLALPAAGPPLAPPARALAQSHADSPERRDHAGSSSLRSRSPPRSRQS
jgi:hypothetical protein